MYFPFGDSYFYSLMVYSNEVEGENLTFKYYNSLENEIVDYNEKIEFSLDMIVGNGFDTFGLS